MYLLKNLIPLRNVAPSLLTTSAPEKCEIESSSASLKKSNDAHGILLNLYKQAQKIDPNVPITQFLESIMENCEDIKKEAHLLKAQHNSYTFTMSSKKARRLFQSKEWAKELALFLENPLKGKSLSSEEHTPDAFLNLLLDQCKKEHQAGRGKCIQTDALFQYSIRFNKKILTVFVRFDETRNITDIRLNKKLARNIRTSSKANADAHIASSSSAKNTLAQTCMQAMDPISQNALHFESALSTILSESDADILNNAFGENITTINDNTLSGMPHPIGGFTPTWELSDYLYDMESLLETPSVQTDLPSDTPAQKDDAYFESIMHLLETNSPIMTWKAPSFIDWDNSPFPEVSNDRLTDSPILKTTI